VIPGTLLGALFLAACLVPGYIFLQCAERRRASLSRSTLLEAVGLTGVGAATSLVAVTIVLALARWSGVFDPSALADDPGRYVLLHPIRVLGPMLVAFAGSCGLAWIAAQVAYAGDPSVFRPGTTAWNQVLWGERTSVDDQVVLTIELTDGRRVAGILRNFSVELEDNREIAIAKPAWQATADAPLVASENADFLILREERIASITGRYIAPKPAA
jgi:uncharacterized protein DUF6338